MDTYPSQLQSIHIYSYWSGFATPSHHSDWLKIDRRGVTFFRRAGLSQCTDTIPELLIDALISVLQEEAAHHSDLISGRSTDLPQERRDSWTDDYPQMQIEVSFADGAKIKLTTESQHAFMIPWRIEWLDTPHWINTNNKRISTALYDLLPDEFLNRERLTRWELGLIFGHTEEVSEVREKKASPRNQVECDLPKDHPNWFDEFGQTRLMCVASPPFKIKRRIFDNYVLAGANVNAQRYDGCTGILCAAAGGNVEIVEAWLAAKADVNIAEIHGATPLMCTFSIEIAEMLLAAGANASAYDKDGVTVLMHAAKAHSYRTEDEKLALARVLLDAGADIRALDFSGKSAADHARDAMNEQNVDYEVSTALFGKERTDAVVGLAFQLYGEDHSEVRQVPRGDGSALVKFLEHAQQQKKPNF